MLRLLMYAGRGFPHDELGLEKHALVLTVTRRLDAVDEQLDGSPPHFAFGYANGRQGYGSILCDVNIIVAYHRHVVGNREAKLAQSPVNSDRDEVVVTRYRRRTLTSLTEVVVRGRVTVIDAGTGWHDVILIENQTLRTKRTSHPLDPLGDRKSTRLNSSHVAISYAVFCLKKKTTQEHTKAQTT